MQIKDHLGNRVNIDSLPLFSAGQAEIYKIQNKNMVAKLYHKLDDNKRNRLNNKLIFMVKNPPFDKATPTNIVQSIVWPEKVLYDDSGDFIGFSMPFIEKSKILSILTIPSYADKNDKIWLKFNSNNNKSFFNQRVAICYNLVSVLQKIHESNRYIIVDLKPDNILIDIEGKIALIDIDSIQVVAPNAIYYADAWTKEDYCPPEFYISKMDPKQEVLDPNWDYFLFAIIAYQLFFQLHPFMGVTKTNFTISDNIKHKYFAHGKNKGVFQSFPPPHNNFNNLSSELQKYFVQTLDGESFDRVNFNDAKEIFSKHLSSSSWKNMSIPVIRQSKKKANKAKVIRQTVNKYATTQTNKPTTIQRNKPVTQAPSKKLKINYNLVALFIILSFFIYSYVAPYFGKYPIDFDHNLNLGSVKKIVNLNNERYASIGSSREYKGGFSYTADGLFQTVYNITVLNKKGHTLWKRKDKGDVNIDDIVSDHDGFVILGHGKNNNKSVVYIRKFNGKYEELFTKIYHTNSKTRGNSINKTSNGFMISGEAMKEGKRYFYVISTNKYGQKKWDRLYGGYNSYWGFEHNTIVKQIGNNYLISGTTFEYGGSKNLRLILINEAGQQIWSNEKEEGFYIDKIVNITNGIRIIGHNKATIHNVTFKLKQQIIERKEFNINNSCQINSLVLMHNGNYLVVGDDGGFIDQDACVIEVNKLGKTVWDNIYNQATYFSSIHKEKGGYLISGRAFKWPWEDDDKDWLVMKIKNDKESGCKNSKLDNSDAIEEGCNGSIFPNTPVANQLNSHSNNKFTSQAKTTKSHSGNYKVVKIRSNDTLNVRTGAGTYNRKIGGLAYNAINIKVVGCKKISNGEKWCNIRHNGINGWVSARYLQRERLQKRTYKESSEYIGAYYARISSKDHYGKNNQKLKDAGTILQQDRANYHKYHRRDRDDTGDNRFDTRGNRNKIKRMLARGSTSQNTLDAIRYSTPLVKVKIYQEHIDVTLESKGGQTRQRQHRKTSTQRTTVPVMVGGEPDLDACGAVGVIRGISRNGDGFLAVRSGPGSKYKMIDKLYRNGERVTMCDDKGKWVGIVYGRNCGVGTPIPKRKPYEGSCKSGWIFEKYIRMIAG